MELLELNSLIGSMKTELDYLVERMEKNRRVGSHIPKLKTYFSTVSYAKDYLGAPFQIFTGSNKSYKFKEPNPWDIKETNDFIQKHQLVGFIHSVYLINLSKTPQDTTERSKEVGRKGLERLKNDLRVGALMGFKGVVVHTGKSVGQKYDKAVNKMYDNIISLMEYIDPKCPLIIETPSGQGTEILTKYDSFVSFYNRFTNEQKKKVKVCVDTCHVWASDHDPLKYIQSFMYSQPGSLVLVHYKRQQGTERVKKGSSRPNRRRYNRT